MRPGLFLRGARVAPHCRRSGYLHEPCGELQSGVEQRERVVLAVLGVHFPKLFRWRILSRLWPELVQPLHVHGFRRRDLHRNGVRAVFEPCQLFHRSLRSLVVSFVSECDVYAQLLRRLRGRILFGWKEGQLHCGLRKIRSVVARELQPR